VTDFWSLFIKPFRLLCAGTLLGYSAQTWLLEFVFALIGWFQVAIEAFVVSAWEAVSPASVELYYAAGSGGGTLTGVPLSAWRWVYWLADFNFDMVRVLSEMATVIALVMGVAFICWVVREFIMPLVRGAVTTAALASAAALFV